MRQRRAASGCDVTTKPGSRAVMRKSGAMELGGLELRPPGCDPGKHCAPLSLVTPNARSSAHCRSGGIDAAKGLRRPPCVTGVSRSWSPSTFVPAFVVRARCGRGSPPILMLARKVVPRARLSGLTDSVRAVAPRKWASGKHIQAARPEEPGSRDVIRTPHANRLPLSAVVARLALSHHACVRMLKHQYVNPYGPCRSPWHSARQRRKKVVQVCLLHISRSRGLAPEVLQLRLHAAVVNAQSTIHPPPDDNVSQSKPLWFSALTFPPPSGASSRTTSCKRLRGEEAEEAEAEAEAHKQCRLPPFRRHPAVAPQRLALLGERRRCCSGRWLEQEIAQPCIPAFSC